MCLSLPQPRGAPPPALLHPCSAPGKRGGLGGISLRQSLHISLHFIQPLQGCDHLGLVEEHNSSLVKVMNHSTKVRHGGRFAGRGVSGGVVAQLSLHLHSLDPEVVLQREGDGATHRPALHSLCGCQGPRGNHRLGLLRSKVYLPALPYSCIRHWCWVTSATLAGCLGEDRRGRVCSRQHM